MANSVRERARHLTRAPVFVAPDDSVSSVAQRLWTENVGAAVVVETREPLGVISERDIVAQLAQGADPDAVTAREAMTRPVIAAHLDDPVLDVAFLMIDDVIRHVPLVDEDGDVTGMVSIRDLVRPLLLDVLGG